MGIKTDLITLNNSTKMTYVRQKRRKGREHNVAMLPRFFMGKAWAYEKARPI